MFPWRIERGGDAEPACHRRYRIRVGSANLRTETVGGQDFQHYGSATIVMARSFHFAFEKTKRRGPQICQMDSDLKEAMDNTS